jgi:polyhydroxybutyrate depolymerase
MKTFITVLMLMLASVAYGQQTIYDTIIHDGLQRSFILYVPGSLSPGTAVPLVINFHGYTSNAFEQMHYGDFRDIADLNGFLLVHPMGTLDGSGNTYWNSNWGGEVDDIGFTEALIDSLAADFEVDTERVYSTGMSNGGFMSYTLACELSHRIAAIASVTGTMNAGQVSSCNPSHPMPVMEIHGTADFVVPYNGNIFMESIPNVIDYWVNFNDCNSLPVVNQIPDIDPGDGCTAEHYRYVDGLHGVEVEHYKVINGGHTWPGTSFPSGGGNTNQDFSASEKIWAFFDQYDINGKIESTATGKFSIPNSEISIYPNPAREMLTIIAGNPAVDFFTVENLMGIRHYEIAFSVERSHTFSVAALDQGIYFLRFYDDQNQLVNTQKLLVE